MTSIYFYTYQSKAYRHHSLTVDDSDVETVRGKLLAKGFHILRIYPLKRPKPPINRWSVKVFRGRYFLKNATLEVAEERFERVREKYPTKRIILLDEWEKKRLENWKKSKHGNPT